MDSEELRRAAEMAGLVIRHDPARSWWAGQDDTPFSWEWRADDPALPAFIASLLVEKVKETESVEAWCAYTTALPILPYLATDEQRIRAAMEVVK